MKKTILIALFVLIPFFTAAKNKKKPKIPENMVFIPAGEFIMGSEVYEGEKPVHTVFLDAYFIDKYEVINAHYKKCVDAGACYPPDETKYYDAPELVNHPVVYMTWEHAESYCAWAGKRLPTEAEWEKAARGENGTVYPWGNSWDGNTCNSGNYNGPLTGKMAKMSEGRGTLPVGSLAGCVSPFGAYDMAGNVWEWVSDWYDALYYKKRMSALPAGMKMPKNPKGPESGEYKVLRGCSWWESDTDGFRGGARGEINPPDVAGSYVFGFRCAKDAP